MNDSAVQTPMEDLRQVPDQTKRLGELVNRLQDYVTHLEERTVTARDANKTEKSAESKTPAKEMCGLARTLWEHNNQIANDLIRLANVTDALEL